MSKKLETQIDTDKRNKKIADAWQKAVKAGNTGSKEAFAKLHGISARTLNRILDDFGLRNVKAAKQPTAAKPAPKKKKTVAKPKAKAAPAVKETKNETPKAEPKSETPAKPVDEPATEDTTSSIPSGHEALPEGTGIVSFTCDKKRFISVLLTDGETLVVEPDNSNYTEILHNLVLGEYDAAVLLMSRKKQIEAMKIGIFTINESGMSVSGVPVHNAVVDEIVDLFLRNESVEHLVKFTEKLMRSPSKTVYENLFKMLKNASVQINKDGNVVCFKKVRANYTDVHSGKFDNSPGTHVVMQRTGVDANPNRTCSAGLHVCAHSYLKEFGGQKVLRVIVEPQDFVAVPTDYGFTKARTCAYYVDADITADVEAGKYSD